ncbi:MAG: DUF4339 domain-containing protein [Thermoguttaceae bacterium]
MAAIQWYYWRGGQQFGPVSSAELKRLADQKDLAPEALVWREGMAQWVPARSVRGLFEGEAALPKATPLSETPPGAEAPPAHAPLPAFESFPAAFHRSREGKPSHLFDFVLASARRQFPPQFVDAAARLFGLFGHYALYAAMALVLAWDLTKAIQTRQALPAVFGLVTVVLLAVFQYAAGRYLAAGERLNRGSPARMASSALSDCVAILCALSGLAILIGLTVMALWGKSFWSISTAVAGFIICQYLAAVAMNPESVNLAIATDAGARDEILGGLAFLGKLVLRVAPVGFGVGVAWGMLDVVHVWVDPPAPAAAPSGGLLGLVLPAATGMADLMKDLSSEVPELRGAAGGLPELGGLSAVAASAPAIPAKIGLLAAAALPILAYYAFLVVNFLIDLCSSLLSLPARLDRLRPEKPDEEGQSQQG